MRIESSVTSVSWIPSEAVTGMTKLSFEVGITHDDNPPPDVIEDLEGLGAADGFRFANRVGAWIEVENGEVVDQGYSGGAVMGATTVRLGTAARFAAIGFPDIRRDPEVTPHVGPLRANRGRPPGDPRAPARQPSTLRAAQGPDGLDDPGADVGRRRFGALRA